VPALAEFDVEIERDLEGVALAWPERPDADELEGNHFYQDLRGFDWDKVRTTIVIERRLVSDFQAAGSEAEGLSVIAALRESRSGDRDNDPWSNDPLWGLDAGICSTVMSLSATGCIPFSSCNGGAFGGTHVGGCPVVAFFMPREVVSVLLDCAAEAGIGVRPFGDGRVQVYASRVQHMIDFAERLLSRLGGAN